MTTTANPWGNKTDRLADVIVTTERDLANVEHLLRSVGGRIRRSVEAVERALDGGLHINDLGELQGDGPKFDQLCGRRQALIEQLKMLRWAAEEGE